MRITVIISSLIIVSIGIIGFVYYSTFFKIDKCLDRGGSWNYETNKCENGTQKTTENAPIELIETKWYSVGNNTFPGDTLTFKTENIVEYFLGELSWTFDSYYKIKKDVVIIETATTGFELNDITGLKPDLIQIYIATADTLNLIYLANWRENKWIEASKERYNNIRNFRLYYENTQYNTGE